MEKKTRRLTSDGTSGVTTKIGRRERGNRSQNGTTARARLSRASTFTRVWRLCKKYSLAFVNSRLILSLPLVAILLITSTDFLVLTTFSDSYNNLFFTESGKRLAVVDRGDAEILKVQSARYIYFLVLVLCLLNLKVVHTYFRTWPHLLVLYFILLLGVFISVEPVKVITNVLIIAMGFLIAILFSIANRNKPDALFVAVLLSMIAIHISSVGVFFLYDFELLEFIQSDFRYAGLTGNPNSLGYTAVLGSWGALCLILSRTCRNNWRIAALLCLPIFVLHIIMSGSGTAAIAFVVVAVFLLWLRVLSSVTLKKRMALNLSAVFLFTLGLLAVSVSNTPAEIYLSFTESMGKDSTLTGRTELWAIAREAIGLRPVFGWGFDSHISVKSEHAFDIPFHHYHNGFLDTLVAGGFLLLIVVFYNIYTFAATFIKVFQKRQNYFPLIMPLIMLLFLNLSEYSLVRPNSPLWEIYVAAFVLLTFSKENSEARNSDRSLSRSSFGRRRRRKQLSWR